MRTLLLSVGLLALLVLPQVCECRVLHARAQPCPQRGGAEGGCRGGVPRGGGHLAAAAHMCRRPVPCLPAPQASARMAPGEAQQMGGEVPLDEINEIWAHRKGPAQTADTPPGRRRRHLAGEISGSKQCTYDDECPPGKPCVFDYDAYYLGLCFSRCGLCAL